MEELLAKMASLLQDIYDEGHGGEFRPSIQEVLVSYNAAQQSVRPTYGSSVTSHAVDYPRELHTSNSTSKPPISG